MRKQLLIVAVLFISFTLTGQSKNNFNSSGLEKTADADSIAISSFLLNVKDGGFGHVDLIFGINPAATEGIDRELGEEELPPLPPAGAFDARFVLADNVTGTAVDYRETLEQPDAFFQYFYTLNLQPSDSATAYTFNFSSLERANGDIIIHVYDNITGELFDTSFVANDNLPFEFTVENLNLTSYKIELMYDFVGVEDNTPVPNGFSVQQNYPNPFNPATNISFTLPTSAEVSVVVYNLLGQKVMEVANKSISAGNHNMKLNMSNLASGIYLYAVNAKDVNGNTYSDIKKMILMK